MLENIIEDMGYEMCSRITVHFHVPLMSVSRNGLMEIKDEKDCQAMLAYVQKGHHFLSVYLDHDASIRVRDLDDVLYLGDASEKRGNLLLVADREQISNVPDTDVFAKHGSEERAHQLQVIDSQQMSNVTDSCVDRARKRKNAECESASELHGSEDDDQEDSDYDPKEIVDSDLDVSDGDDDLSEDNVDNSEDEEVKILKGQGKEKAKAKMLQEVEKIWKQDVEEDEIWGPATDVEGMLPRFKIFRQQDMHDPKFHVGLCFESVEQLRKAIHAYSCVNRQDIKLPVNDKKRVNARCSKGCKWNLWASYSSISKSFMTKTFEGGHSHCCSKTFKVHSFTSNFLAERYLESFRADQDMNMKNFSRIIQKDWNMTAGRSKLQRARRLAMKVIYGDEEAHYKMLWDYANELRRSNPGSSFFLSLDENTRFRRCYMCLEVRKEDSSRVVGLSFCGWLLHQNQIQRAVACSSGHGS
jgi:hypothetical protein